MRSRLQTDPRPDPIDSEAKLADALAAFDAVNARDPDLEDIDGKKVPKALIYGHRMSECLECFCPNASLPLKLAARCQHIERWKSPRQDYPAGRAGYLQWRQDLKRFHADRAGALLQDLGFPEATVGRVQSLLRKERMKKDPESQALEDVACLVFLEHYFDAFQQDHTAEKVVDILRKTWRKMSKEGQGAAGALRLSPEARDLVKKALRQD